MYYPIRRARIPGFDIDELTRLYQRAVKVERLTFRLQDKVGIVSMGDKGNHGEILIFTIRSAPQCRVWTGRFGGTLAILRKPLANVFYEAPNIV